MKPRRSSFLVPWRTGAVLLLLTLPAYPGSGALEDLIRKSQAAMEANQWTQALELSQSTIDRFGGTGPLATYGPQFGAIFYQKGVCEMKLKRWQEAMRSFEICYRDFPNENGRRDNSYQTLALLKWGESAMGAGDWALATSKFEKFIDERDRLHDTFAQGAFYVNLAVCQYQLGRLSEGNESLEIALANRLDFPTPDAGILAGFQALVEAALAQRDEQTLLDFFRKNRGELIVDAPEMRRTAGTFLKLAGDAQAAGRQRAAIALYQFVPSDAADLTSPGTPDIVKLAGMALLHERAGNPRGALASYRQLVLYFPQAAGREEYFYHLVRTAMEVEGEDSTVRGYVAGFLKEFPGSPHAEEVRAGSDVGTAEAWPPRLLPVTGWTAGASLPDTAEFARALDLYQGRKYQDAAMAFAEIKSGTAESPDSDVLAFAAFYEAQCLRKSGDLKTLSRELKSLPRPTSLGTDRLRQLKIDGFCDAVRAKNWQLVSALGTDFELQALPGDQRAQIAYCQGLVCENAGQQTAALDFYNAAMTADAGASEEVARQAALGVLRILYADPGVQDALNQATSGSAAVRKIQEAAAVARLFEQALGAGAQLPAQFRIFLKWPGEQGKPKDD